MWTDCITSIRHVLKLNGYGGPQAKANEKRQRFKGWETLVNYHKKGETYARRVYLHFVKERRRLVVGFQKKIFQMEKKVGGRIIVNFHSSDHSAVSCIWLYQQFF